MYDIYYVQRYEIYLYFKNNLNLLDSETRNVLVRIIVPDSEESRDNNRF